MTSQQKYQIAGEIENEGFEYWLENYASSSLSANNAPQHIIDAAEKAVLALNEAERVFEAEGLMPEY